MKRHGDWTRWTVLAGLVALCLTVVTGCPVPGPQGAPGEDGPPGTPGPDAVAELPGTVVTITAVSGASPVQAGGPLNVTFTVETNTGQTIDIAGLDGFSMYVSGPADDYQRVITPQNQRGTSVTQNSDGSYTYTFAGGFPATFAAPVNDSDAFDRDGIMDYERTGEAVVPGTYTVAIEAHRMSTADDDSVRYAGDATFDFAVGGVRAAPRQLVLESKCENCHADLMAHDGTPFSVTGCVLCHTSGAEDRTSSDPAKATPGVTIQFANLIHKIHRGANLPSVAATANGFDRCRYEVVDSAEQLRDFSDVKFPLMPGGNGFNEQTRNCDACHGGAAQEDQIYADQNITRANCGSCHDDLDFTSGTVLDPDNAGVAAGTLATTQLNDPAHRVAPGGTSHQFADDGACAGCHGAGKTWAAETVHRPPLLRYRNMGALRVEILSVTGSSIDGFFRSGDVPVVTFNLLDGDEPVDIGEVAVVAMALSGPVENYQKVLPTDWTTGSTIEMFRDGVGEGGVPNSGTGPFTYTSAEAIPANYPVPSNDSTAFDFGGGWGELSGQPLEAGSYTLMVTAWRRFEVDGTRFRETWLPAVTQIRIGSAGETSAYAGLVTDEKCNACHGDLHAHGNIRKGVQGCVVCHVAGAEDRANLIDTRVQGPEADSVDWKIMIHKIHDARELDVVRGGGGYELVGWAAGTDWSTGKINDFSAALLPTMPGGARHCTACHATGAWKQPADRDGVNIWMVACTSCHDSAATADHVALNTLAGTPATETCADCHGDGAANSVEKSHAVP